MFSLGHNTILATLWFEVDLRVAAAVIGLSLTVACVYVVRRLTKK